MVSAYEIENECESDCLKHRAYALPMVYAGVNQLVATYEGSKRFSPTLAGWLETVEATAQQTIDKTTPFYEKYLSSAVLAAGRVACYGLDHVEERFPAIKTSPEDIRGYASDVYEKSVVKKSVDTVVAVKEKSVKKVTDSYTYVVGTVRTRVNSTTGQLLAVITYAENMVDTYVADDLPSVSRDHNYATQTAFTRITRLPYRIYLGVDFKTRRNLYEMRMVIVRSADSLHARVDAVREWRRVKQTRAIEQMQRIKEMPGALALRGVRTSTGALAFVSDRLMRMSETVSHVALTPLAATNAYLHELDSHAKQSSLTDIADDVWTQARERVSRASAVMLHAVDVLSRQPIISSVTVTKKNEKKSE